LYVLLHFAATAKITDTIANAATHKNPAGMCDSLREIEFLEVDETAKRRYFK
jgi:hypothetical protein